MISTEYNLKARTLVFFCSLFFYYNAYMNKNIVKFDFKSLTLNKQNNCND